MVIKMNNSEVMNSIYTELYNIIAPKIGENPPSDFLSLFTAGRTVTDGMDISSLANTIPLVNKSYSSSGKLVSGAYQIALSGHFKSDQPHTSQETEEYDSSINLLYQDYGKENQEYSVKYKKYKKAKKKLNSALDALEAARQNPNYPIYGNKDLYSIKKLEYKVDEAYDDLIMSNRDEVDKALKVISTYRSASPGAYVLRLNDMFVSAAEKKFAVTCDPFRWTNEDAWKKLAWKKVEIKACSSRSKIHSEVDKTENSFGDNYKSGFWFFSSGGSGEGLNYSLSKDLDSITTTDKLAISLELSEVFINRDWLDISFFHFEDVYIDGQSKGCITKGSLSAADVNKCAMPIMPVSLILARDVKIYDDFNENVSRFIERAKAESSSYTHFGPFGSSTGSAKHSSSSSFTDEEKRNYPQQSKIEFPGVMLVGIKSTVTSPMFPQRDA